MITIVSPVYGDKKNVKLLYESLKHVLTELKIEYEIILVNDCCPYGSGEEIAKIAASENENKENIGARRLHTVMELLLEDISFNAGGLDVMTDVVIDKKYVLETLDKEVNSLNLRKYIL